MRVGKGMGQYGNDSKMSLCVQGRGKYSAGLEMCSCVRAYGSVCMCAPTSFKAYYLHGHSRFTGNSLASKIRKRAINLSCPPIILQLPSENMGRTKASRNPQKGPLCDLPGKRPRSEDRMYCRLLSTTRARPMSLSLTMGNSAFAELRRRGDRLQKIGRRQRRRA